MRDLTLRNDVIETCRWLRMQGLVFSTWGNVSVRTPEGYVLITPTKVDYDEMLPEDLVVLALDGTILSGHRLSTSEREIHLGVMRKRRDVGAIIHTHSPYAMAACARNSGIPPFSEEICQLIGGAIPLSSRFVPSSRHLELGEVVTASVTNANAILIRNHGPMCFGRDLREACVCCQVVEKSAKIYLHLLAAGSHTVVPGEFVKDGRDYYMNDYGKT